MLPRCSRSIPRKPRCSPQSTAYRQLGDAVPRCPTFPSRNMAGTEIKPNYASLPVQWEQILDPRYHRIPA